MSFALVGMLQHSIARAAGFSFATSEKGKFVANAEALKTCAKFADETPSMFAAETLEVQEDYATPDDRILPGCRPRAATLAHAPVTALHLPQSQLMQGVLWEFLSYLIIL